MSTSYHTSSDLIFLIKFRVFFKEFAKFPCHLHLNLTFGPLLLFYVFVQLQDLPNLENFLALEQLNHVSHFSNRDRLQKESSHQVEVCHQWLLLNWVQFHKLLLHWGYFQYLSRVLVQESKKIVNYKNDKFDYFLRM